MPRKKLFPGTDLGLKIKKHENADERRAANFVNLCKFYGLDATHFDRNDSSVWRLLCEAMMRHLVPGFQMNTSGGKPRHTASSDYEIYSDYSIYSDFADWLSESNRKNRKARITELSEKYKCTQGQVRAAVARYQKLINTNPAAAYDPDLASEIPAYVTNVPSKNRYTKTMRRKVSTK